MGFEMRCEKQASGTSQKQAGGMSQKQAIGASFFCPLTGSGAISEKRNSAPGNRRGQEKGPAGAGELPVLRVGGRDASGDVMREVMREVQQT